MQTIFQTDLIRKLIIYTSISAIALLVDLIVYTLLINASFGVKLSAATGYSIGLIVAYTLMSGRLFKDSWLRENLVMERFLFIVSGFLGIFITYMTVALCMKFLTPDKFIAKALAVIFSFLTVLAFRRFVVFRKKSD